MKYNKIAIISDIHGNLESLKIFLKYIEEENIDLVLNLGDFISNGPHACAVFDSIINHKKFVNIMGYDEESLFNTSKEAGDIDLKEDLKKTLGERRIKKLKELPRLKEITIEKKRILMTHNNGVSWITQKTAHESQKQEESYDYIFYGGSHRQELTHNKEPFIRKKIIDPGSLGCIQENTGYFVILDFSKANTEIAFKTIEVNEHKISSEQLSKEIFLHIYESRRDKKGEKFMQPEVIQMVLEMAIKQSRYVCIGCWNYEKKLIKEILWHLKCRGFKKCIASGQEWYIGEITEEVVGLLLENNRDQDHKFKWLEVSFQDTLEDRTPIYSIFHYGSECFLRRLSSNDLDIAEELLKQKEVSYTIDSNPYKEAYKGIPQKTKV